MGIETDFWLVLHQLAQAAREEGKTRKTRLERIIENFESFPAVTQDEVIEDFRFLLGEFTALEPALAKSLGARPTGKPRRG